MKNNQRRKLVIHDLKNLDIERMQLEEAVALLAFGKLVRTEFEQATGDTPEWLGARIRELGREIHARSADAKELRLRELKARREALLPTEQKRAKIEEEIAKLEAQVSA